METIAVVGAGAWGTAFAKILADAGHACTIWGRNEAVVREINQAHTNSARLPGFTLPDTITATADLPGLLATASVVVVALPSQKARAVLTDVQIAPDATIVSLMKGVELSTDLRMSEMLIDTLQIPSSQVVVVSGPNLAREIADGQPAATVVAGSDSRHTKAIARLCITDYFRPYTNADVIGVELGGAVKNVIAIAAGMAAGVGYGDNTKATIITRGLAEITRLAITLGADPQTMAGLAGMGDLVATCASPLSRNHTFGAHMGRGLGIDEAIAATGGTVEGAKSCRSVLELAHTHNVDMPLTAAVVAAVYDGLDIHQMTANLLSRPHKDERA
ncbi:MAG: NAD(P)H-dependent glycerol-3-phosphate dehydrogenase [Bowdeniella nasicola]|nr:NAD(P)H-dependent glycerol-3-phosphate dehydrogenase [Bowdeniella nasicola]